jgi:hypothetical protein
LPEVPLELNQLERSAKSSFFSQQNLSIIIQYRTQFTMKVFNVILTPLTLLPSIAIAQSPVDDALAQFQQLNDRIDSAQRSISGYNGGVLLALPVANSLYSAHTAATTARQSLTALDPLSPEDSQRALNAYNEVHPRLLATLAAGRDKVHTPRLCVLRSSRI